LNMQGTSEARESASAFLGVQFGMPRPPLDPKQDREARLRYWVGRCREVFEVFEPKEGMGIDRAAIPNILQALGFNPTLEHVTEVEERIVPRGPDGTIPEDANIQLEPFLRELPRLLADTKEGHKWIRDSYHKLVRAFAAFDPEGNGWVDAQDMLNVLRDQDHALNTGPVFTDEEVQSFLHACADDQSRIYYEEYCFKLAEDGRNL